MEFESDVAAAHEMRALYQLACNQLKIRDIIKRIEADGWKQVAQKGSHRQYKNATKAGRVTIPGHPGDDVATGTLKNIYRQAQIEEN